MRECTLTNITILKTYLLRNCQDQRIADCDYYYLTILNIENVEKKRFTSHAITCRRNKMYGQEVNS